MRNPWEEKNPKLERFHEEQGDWLRGYPTTRDQSQMIVRQCPKSNCGGYLHSEGNGLRCNNCRTFYA